MSRLRHEALVRPRPVGAEDFRLDHWYWHAARLAFGEVTPEHGAMVLDGILRGEWPPSLTLPPWWPTGPYFHGGFPGLEVGDLLLPGHRKPSAPPAAPLSSRVCVTTLEEHARTYAAWYFPEPHEPGGDLYEVEPVGLIARGRCDMPERWVCKTARVVRVVERGLVAR